MSARMRSIKVRLLSPGYLAPQGTVRPLSGTAPSSGPHRLLVLAKETYFEKVQRFPFAGPGEIASAVRLDPGAYCPFSTDLFFFKRLKHPGGETDVNLWFVRPRAARLVTGELQPRPWVLVPETALLAGAAPGRERLYVVRRSCGWLLAYVDRNGLVRSTAAENDREDPAAFRRSLGREALAAPLVRFDDPEDYERHLGRVVSDLPLTALRAFSAGWAPDPARIASLKIPAVSVAVILALYGFGRLSLPLVLERHWKRENARLEETLSGVLELQAQLERTRRLYRTLAQPLSEYAPRLSLLTTLMHALPEGTRISELRVAGRTVELNGSAPKASDALARLAAVSSFQQASFNGPLRKDPKTGRDVFSLTFLYRPVSSDPREKEDQ